MISTLWRTGPLRWTEMGPIDGRGLLLIHSLGTDSRMWQPQLDAFAAVRRVVAVDLPGHGRSSAQPGEYRLDDLGRDLLQVADQAGHTRFDVCGISLGGMLGLWLAANAPERVLTLVASNTAARLGSEEQWSVRMHTVLEQGMEAIRPTVMTRFFTSGFDLRHPAQFEAVTEMFRAVDPVGYAGCCALLRDADISEKVTAIRCPTLIIGGEEDVATPPTQAEWLHRQIRGSRLQIIPQAAHLANLEQPETFTRLVLTELGWS